MTIAKQALSLSEWNEAKVLKVAQNVRGGNGLGNEPSLTQSNSLSKKPKPVLRNGLGNEP
ncbi:hypothetical protein J8L98_23180 [Pseudoalteromonas sp. MMG013]|uniref:hypothetical protein n=1 Tax=Pseudoalteromonas sp. MMG013 TaxID=2822687 RepID=UPI001B372828|nr:hypothetical protein [Pseudoalteromonas sp. MMG013]MBQ4864590.1 hypothetical protein [Pseudoalteromonas sp. MMG013]